MAMECQAKKSIWILVQITYIHFYCCLTNYYKFTGLNQYPFNNSLPSRSKNLANLLIFLLVFAHGENQESHAKPLFKSSRQNLLWTLLDAYQHQVTCTHKFERPVFSIPSIISKHSLTFVLLFYQRHWIAIYEIQIMHNIRVLKILQNITFCIFVFSSKSLY